MTRRNVELTINVDQSKVRALCIERNLYTEGTNEEYGMMFEKCRRAKTAQDVVEIAQDIILHSDIEDECSRYGCSEEEYEEGLAFDIANQCAYVRLYR